jgi:hypothetical protein
MAEEYAKGAEARAKEEARQANEDARKAKEEARMAKEQAQKATKALREATDKEKLERTQRLNAEGCRDEMRTKAAYWRARHRDECFG